MDSIDPGTGSLFDTMNLLNLVVDSLFTQYEPRSEDFWFEGSKQAKGQSYYQAIANVP